MTGAKKTVLAGDIGGTKTNLALYGGDGGALGEPVREQSFPSRRYDGLEAVVAEFSKGGDERVLAAAFGIAGPVFDNVVHATNLPWKVEAESLAKVIGCDRVRLMNDLETTAYGALFLPPDEIETLNPGVEHAGNIAVIAAGTGLGQGYLYWDGERHRPVATEGGHVDFAPRSELEARFLHHLQGKFGRVSYERVLSGPGLVNIFTFLDEEIGRPVEPEIRNRLEREDPGKVIGEAGVRGESDVCSEAVDLFVSLYGAQAGNLALTVMAMGGVFVGGGIVTKLLPKMKSGLFLSSFTDKGRYRGFMSEIPVRVILNPKTSMIGAGQAALDLT